MKSTAIPHPKKTAAMASAKAAPSQSTRPPGTSAPGVPASKTGAMARPVRLLPERFPKPDKKRVCLGYYAPDAESVFVAGTFNDWQPSALPLQRQADGRWMVEFMIGQGRHEYRFIVDGQWMDDPLSPAYAPNPFGGLNCVLVADLQP
jgi:1,4-alpha-glucan branching enzyme